MNPEWLTGRLCAGHGVASGTSKESPYPDGTIRMQFPVFKTTEVEVVSGWIYYPHPETKERHWQPPTTVELLAPRLSGVEPGCSISLRDQRRRIKLVDTIRLRARLLEFLKFRVLASQQTFFEADALMNRRQWLSTMFPEALQLSELDLDRVWTQARSLYTES